MKAPGRFAVVLFFAVGLMSNVVLGQNEKLRGQSDGVRSRAIHMSYDSGQVEGLRIVVYNLEGSNMTPVDPGRNFGKGDRVRMEFESNFDGYVYVVNVAPSGKSAVIYPDSRSKENKNIVIARQRYVLPRPGYFEFVDDEKGTEVLQVIMSRQQIPFFENAIKNSNGNFVAAASSATAGSTNMNIKQSGIDSENVKSVLPKSGTNGVRSRKVELAPPKDKDEQGTVVTVSNDKLDPGDVAVFEIRLRHV